MKFEWQMTGLFAAISNRSLKISLNAYSEKLSLEEVLAAILDSLKQVVSFESGGVFLCDDQGVDLNFLRYGFLFKRTGVSTETVHDRIESVCDKALESVRRSGNPSLAVILGVDDAWEVGVMKFTLEMIMKSRDINHFDFKRRGLL